MEKNKHTEVEQVIYADPIPPNTHRPKAPVTPKQPDHDFQPLNTTDSDMVVVHDEPEPPKILGPARYSTQSGDIYDEPGPPITLGSSLGVVKEVGGMITGVVSVQLEINISNDTTYALANPSWFTSRGTITTPCGPVIDANHDDRLIAVNCLLGRTGCSGGISWLVAPDDAAMKPFRVFVMWSIPLDLLGGYGNLLAVGVTESGNTADDMESLDLDSMSEGKNVSAKGMRLDLVHYRSDKRTKSAFTQNAAVMVTGTIGDGHNTLAKISVRPMKTTR